MHLSALIERLLIFANEQLLKRPPSPNKSANLQLQQICKDSFIFSLRPFGWFLESEGKKL